MNYARNDRVIATRLDEETAVLLHLDQQHYYSLNETGARIWELLPEHPTAEGMIGALLNEFEAPREEVAGTVADFLETMTAADIIHTDAP